MADLKISQLSAVSEVQGTDVFPTVSGLATMKASAAQIKTYVTESLDVNDSAVAGSYVTAVSEADGVISVTREAADVKPTANSTKMLTSGGAKAALDEKQNTLTFDNTPTANSNNPVKSGGVYTEVNSLKETLTNEVVTRATLGAHNINGTEYVSKSGSGLTWTVNSDGSVTVSGTADGDITNGQAFISSITAQVILTGGISDNAHILPWDITDDARPYTDSTKTSRVSGVVNSTNQLSFYIEKGHSYRMTLRVYTGNTVSGTFKPLLRLATDPDTTFRPYAATNQQLTGLISNDFTNGAVNLLENKGVAEIVGNITWTINDDKSIKGNGTSDPSSGDWTLYYIVHDTSAEWLHLKAGVHYKFSCCPAGGSADTFFVQLLYRTAVGGTSLSYGKDTGNGIEFTPSTDVICYVRIAVYKTVILSNKEFRPMLTLDVPNSDYNHYVPYAKSNKELTDDVIELQKSSISNDIDISTYNASNNPYTCPSDGYAVATATASTAGTLVTIQSADNTSMYARGISFGSGAVGVATLYCKKGMKIFCASANTFRFFKCQ